MKVNFNVLNQKSAPALYESSLANRPTAGYIGRLFIDTDIPSTGIYWDSGTAWYKIASASIAETQSLNDVCVIGNSTVTLGTYIFGQSTYGQKSGAAIPVEPDYALTIGRGNSVNDKSLYVAFNSILNGLVNVIGGNTASNPGLKVSGGWFTGGSATTTKPQLLVEPDSTTSTAWSTLGTGLGINAATGFTGRLFDFQINAVSKAVLLANGNLLIGTTTDSGYKLDVNGTAKLQSTVTIGTGSVTLVNTANLQGRLTITRGTANDICLNIITQGSGAVVFQGTQYLNYSALESIIFQQNGGASSFGGSAPTELLELERVYSGAATINNSCLLVKPSITKTGGTNTVNILNIQPVFNSAGGTNIIRGYYYNPTITSITNITSRAIETATGNVILGSSSGSVGIGANTTINNSAILDITSTTQGVLLPRMTTVQKTAIASPAAGLMVYDTTLNKLCVFTTAWETITSV